MRLLVCPITSWFRLRSNCALTITGLFSKLFWTREPKLPPGSLLPSTFYRSLSPSLSPSLSLLLSPSLSLFLSFFLSFYLQILTCKTSFFFSSVLSLTRDSQTLSIEVKHAPIKPTAYLFHYYIAFILIENFIWVIFIISVYAWFYIPAIILKPINIIT